ncbi:MAG: hypothetical protein AAB820_00495, partial [Patescibacteria group bacterium]
MKRRVRKAFFGLREASRKPPESFPNWEFSGSPFQTSRIRMREYNNCRLPKNNSFFSPPFRMGMNFFLFIFLNIYIPNSPSFSAISSDELSVFCL